jgi:hypothetical protein
MVQPCGSAFSGCEEEAGWVEIIVLSPRLPIDDMTTEPEERLIEIDG